MALRIKMIFLFLLIFSTLGFGLTASAADPCDLDGKNGVSTQEAIKCGANDSAGVPVAANPGTRIDTTIGNIIDLLSVAVGIAAVIMLIVGGFRYVTSAGNQETVKAAKNTILYALIGLVIVALAQLIVNFVLNKTTQPPPKPTSLINPRGV